MKEYLCYGNSRRRREKGQRQCIKAIMPENFINLVQEINIQFHVAQRIRNRLNLNRASQKHFIIKLWEVNKRILETAREKREVTCQRPLIRLNSFLNRSFSCQKRMWWHIQNTERKENCQLRILYPEKLPFKNERGVKTFLNKQKLREFITMRPTLQKMLKGVLWVKIKDTN